MRFFSDLQSDGNECESATSASPEKATNCPLEAAQPGSSGWFSGLISGAGNLISSFLDSDSDSSCSSSYSSYSTNEVVDATSEQADEVSSEQFVELMQIVRDYEPVKDFYGRSIAVISGIESKDAIKQLLMQETFSRNEYNKLVKIIQSRVIDFPSAEGGGNGVENEQPCKSCDNSMTSKMNLHSLNKNVKLPETVCVLSAVMEESKWLKQNNFASRSKHKCYLGPCTLNADVLQHDCEGQTFSPVNLAKEYMRSLQPLHSTRQRTNRFKTMPSPRMHHYKDETQCEAASNSTAVLKASKRTYLDLRSWHALDNYRSVRRKQLNASEIEDKDLEAPGESHPSEVENNASLNSISDYEQVVIPVQLDVRNSSQYTNCTGDDNTMLHDPVLFVDGSQVNEKPSGMI